MNREIKFRVWDKDLKRIRYLNTEHDFIRFDSLGQGYYENMQTGLGEWFSDLMQYTGLKDKNGKEIYEGDICLVTILPENYKEKMVTVWCNDRNGFKFQDEDGEVWNVNDTEIEVIGNIYESEVTNEEKWICAI